MIRHPHDIPDHGTGRAETAEISPNSTVRRPRERKSPRVHLIIGPVGAGKSTFSQKLVAQHGALGLNLDDWMAELFSQDRPPTGSLAWYVERTQRCQRQIRKITQSTLAAGTDVVLEIGLILHRDRQALYAWVDECGIALTIYVVDAPRDLRRERVERRNLERGSTFSMAVPADIFELASDLWEAPTESERHGRDLRFVPDSQEIQA